MNNQFDSPHPLNRRMVIADNLELLKALDNETVDLDGYRPALRQELRLHRNAEALP